MSEEYLLVRLRDELKRNGLKVAEVARRLNEDAAGLRDITNGRKRLPAELLVRLSGLGIDSAYVLTGIHGRPAMTVDQERAGYVVDVLSPAEAAAVSALRASGALQTTRIEIHGDGNQAAGRDVVNSQGAKSGSGSRRKPRGSG